MGSAVCFSFHPRKVITTGDGGAVLSSSPELDRRFRLLRQHGMDTPDFKRHTSSELATESYLETGFNYRLTDVQAAMGLVQLGKLPKLLEARRQIALAYRRHLSGLAWLTLPTEPPYARTNWQSYIIRVADGVEASQVRRHLRMQGIDTRAGVMCAHREPPYADAWPLGSLPRSEAARESGIVLPLYPGMTELDVKRVAEALAGFA
jgi:dTDP-4-amino-4,6-dideoxygalactose transaminase